MQTNHKAPNWRVIKVDPANPAESNWVEVLPEKPEPIQSAGTAGGKVVWIQNLAPWESEQSWSVQKERLSARAAKERWEALVHPEALSPDAEADVGDAFATLRF